MAVSSRCDVVMRRYDRSVFPGIAGFCTVERVDALTDGCADTLLVVYQPVVACSARAKYSTLQYDEENGPDLCGNDLLQGVPTGKL